MTSRVTAIDGLLVLMVVIWGVNYSVIKRAFDEIPPQPFNALRLTLSSLVFLAAIRVARTRARPRPGRCRRPSTRRTRSPGATAGISSGSASSATSATSSASRAASP